MSTIRFKVGDIIYKMSNGKIDTTAKYKIKEITIEDNANWHSGYEVTVMAKLSKLGVSINEQIVEDYPIQYMAHMYQMDNVYATLVDLTPPHSPSNSNDNIQWKTL